MIGIRRTRTQYLRMTLMNCGRNRITHGGFVTHFPDIYKAETYQDNMYGAKMRLLNAFVYEEFIAVTTTVEYKFGFLLLNILASMLQFSGYQPIADTSIATGKRYPDRRGSPGSFLWQLCTVSVEPEQCTCQSLSKRQTPLTNHQSLWFFGLLEVKELRVCVLQPSWFRAQKRTIDLRGTILRERQKVVAAHWVCRASQIYCD